MGFEGLIGKELLKKGGEKVATSSLSAKYLMIYFSAHWCGPCRMFTPMLIKFYEGLKQKREDFELVFASSDRDEKAFEEYFSEMPWLAIPYSERAIKEKLSSKFKVKGIPTLVVIDQEGNLITDGARGNVMEDPEGSDFPWIPPTLGEVLGTSFISKGGVAVEKDFKGKIFGLYFSGHWCGPCRRFTPTLIEKYEELKKEGKDFEIIFVSSDQDQAGFDEYFGEMPWIAIPFSDRKRASKLSGIFDVEGIPTFAVVDSDFSIITKGGVAAVYENLPFPFRPPPLQTLSGRTASQINDSPALIVFSDQSKFEETEKVLEPIARENKEAKKEMIFFHAKDDPVVPGIRQFAGLKGTDPVMIILDIPSQRKFVSDAKTFDDQTVRAFVEGYFKESLTSRPIRE